MKDKTYLLLAALIIAVCLLGSAALIAYTVYAYEHSSIIYYIATERW